MYSVKDKVVLVTGASRGIGKAVAQTFCENQNRVFVTAKTGIAQLEELARSYPQSKVYPYKVDFENSQSIKELFDYIVSKEGRLDILICNAGITIDKIIVRATRDDFEKVIKVNLEGYFLCAKYACELMIRKRWGRIIFIGSVAGLIGNVGQSVYCASKSALAGLTKTLAKELGSRGITVNTVAPGFVETEMTEKLPSEYVKNLMQVIPMGRFATPQEIAQCVYFLASEQTSFFTGQTLVIDGGLTLSNF
ncbi:MAG: 3-oxoacyl-ACP reductase FabG [Planctomycetota bacterium]